jgi:hypothetical protein
LKNAERYQQNKDERRSKAKEYKLNHRDKINARRRELRAEKKSQKTID